jgi:hypothetical protein
MSATWKVDLALVIEENSNEIVNDTVAIEETKNKTQRFHVIISDETDDQEFDLSTLIGKAEEVLIISDNEITIKKDSDSATGIKCTKFLVSESDFEKIYISNDSGNDADVIIDVGG